LSEDRADKLSKARSFNRALDKASRTKLTIVDEDDEYSNQLLNHLSKVKNSKH